MRPFVFLLFFLSLMTGVLFAEQAEDSDAESPEFHLPDTYILSSPHERMIVTHTENPLNQISAEQLRNLFLGNYLYWKDGTPVRLALLHEKYPATQKFLDEVLELTPEQLYTVWKRKIFTEQYPSITIFEWPHELLEYVAHKPGAIGVVTDGPENLQVKKLMEIKTNDAEIHPLP